MAYVFDTNAFITGQNVHYSIETFPGVWDSIGRWIVAGEVKIPRAVFVELERQSDAVFEWIKQFREFTLDPDEAVQREAGRIVVEHFSASNPRDEADPFVIAEGVCNGHVVVTYEGVNEYGQPTAQRSKKIPGICEGMGVDCVPLGIALGRLGGSF